MITVRKYLYHLVFVRLEWAMFTDTRMPDHIADMISPDLTIADYVRNYLVTDRHRGD
ncbi:hypothetical protein [Leptolyngbya sp. 7M]|uniref:hypothetical protein n=1 Tax=Leptolyngbya sp. 7M TaxID=2812896 RepID=UPI001B8AE894|nr:hypothetical protein [Leptolyngbya sp. 7M]QYO66430.1 hypothetical protein JVX88_06415 [Leptolyngbya sp. 7M]